MRRGVAGREGPGGGRGLWSNERGLLCSPLSGAWTGRWVEELVESMTRSYITRGTHPLQRLAHPGGISCGRVGSANAWPCQTEPMRNPEKAEDSPPRVTEVPSTRANEAPSSRETGTPSLATSETLHFSSVTKVSDSLATESSPVVETKAPSSLATEGPSSTATKAQAFLTEVPSVSATHMQPSLDEGPVTFLTSTHIPVPKSMDEEASKSSATSVSPKKSLYPKMSLTETGDSQIQEAEPKDQLSEPEAVLPEAEVAPTEAEVELREVELELREVELREPEAESPKAESPEAEAESPVSSEALVPVLLAQERGGQKASLEHSGHPASPSSPTFPSASSNATGGRTLALQSSWTGKARSPHFPSWLQNAGTLCWNHWLGHGKACAFWKILPPWLPPAPCME